MPILLYCKSSLLSSSGGPKHFQQTHLGAVLRAYCRLDILYVGPSLFRLKVHMLEPSDLFIVTALLTLRLHLYISFPICPFSMQSFWQHFWYRSVIPPCLP